jgi:type IV pilus assembly protein PilX
MNPPPSLAHFVSLDSPLKGAHPAARQSRFRGYSRMGMAAPALGEIHASKPLRRQRGATLFVVMVMVLLTTLLLLWASRSARFNEIITGNDSDYQRALEAAQAMLRDAEFDIRGERPDGQPCSATADANCRTDTVTTTPPAAHYPYAAELELNTALVETLDSQTPSCIAGICTPTNVTAEFWTSASGLSAMKPVAATYGQYTGAKGGKVGNPMLRNEAGITAKAWYWVELLPYNVHAAAGDPGNAGIYRPDLDSPYVYRITAVAEGIKPGTQAVVQTIFVRRKTDS